MSATPRLDRYLASLPQGIDSYPECVQKASLSREYSRFLPTAGLVGKVPGPVANLITRPSAASAWIPEVHVFSFFLSVVDLHLGSEEAFASRAYIVNRELLNGPMYRILMLVASPLYLVKNADSRWKTFHRGIEFVTDSIPSEKSGTANFHLTYPKNLMPELLIGSSTAAFRVALEAAGAREVNSQVLRWEPEAAHFSISWRV